VPAARAGDWLSSLAGQSLQVVAQAAAFVLLAGGLGAREFGVWTSLAACSGVIVHVAGFGFGNLLVRDTARDRSSFPVSWGNALLVTSISGAALTVLATLSATPILPRATPPTVVAAVFVSDLLFSRLATLTATACQGLGRIGAMVRIHATLQALRLGAVIAWMLGAPQRSLGSWAAMYAGASAAACALALGWSWLRLARPSVSLARLRRECRDGAGFVVSPFTQVLNNDADKVVLGRLGALDALGAYGAAYRVLSVAFLPVQALLSVTYPGFFERGRRGLAASSGLARSLAPRALGCALLASVAVVAGAPLLPRLLGPGFEESARILRWLSVLPLLKAVQCLCGDAMTGADLQRRRTAIQGGLALANVALNILLDPVFGWRGAAAATLASDSMLAVALWAGAFAARRRPRSVS